MLLQGESGRDGVAQAGSGSSLKGLTIQLVHIVLTGHQGIVDNTDCAPDSVHLHPTNVTVLLHCKPLFVISCCKLG